jgi:hypothetical protein
MHFSLRLAYVRGARDRTVVLRAGVWSYDGVPVLSAGTLTVHTNGENTVLRPLPDAKHGTSHARERLSFEENLGFALPDGLLRKLCTATQAGLLFENRHGSVEVDEAPMARLQAYCRSFYELVVQPVE